MSTRTYRITYEILDGDTVVQVIVREGGSEDVPHIDIDEEGDRLRLNELDANAQ